MNDIIVKENKIQDKIFTIRNSQVLLDKDLAELYQNRIVFRNLLFTIVTQTFLSVY